MIRENKLVVLLDFGFAHGTVTVVLHCMIV